MLFDFAACCNIILFLTLQPFSATWNLLSAVMDVVARSPAIIFRFPLFLTVTHNVTLILFCSSIMILNLFWVSLYFWRIIFIRWTIYSSIQSVWGARSAKRSIALKTAFYVLFAILHVVQDFLSIPKVQTVCFLTFKGLPICEKHFKVQLICFFGVRSSFKAKMPIM